ncbi:MAG: hypothetical protein J1G04_00945 [Clostridiales bacterium]|nr:hypothetical protein [Clostridiales bacterium]
MKCDMCGVREANIEVMQRHNNNINKLHLCSECAKSFKPDLGVFDDFPFFGKMAGPMGLVTGMNGLFDMPTPRTLICPDCKTTSEEFLKTGFVGCPRCYEAFEPLVLQTVRKLQQSDRHVGKSPNGASANDGEIARLESELQRAFDNKNYALTEEISKRLAQLSRERNGGN